MFDRFSCSYGDWFVLYQMSRNMNRRFFSEFLAVLSRRVDPRRDATPSSEDLHKTLNDLDGSQTQEGVRLDQVSRQTCLHGHINSNKLVSSGLK